MIAVLPCEDFEALEPEVAGGGRAAALAEARAAGFAEGFEAGRSFARQEAGADREAARVRALAALEALSFTHVEARAHVLASIMPFIAAAAGRLLPALADRGLPALVAEEVAVLAAEAAPDTLSLRAGSAAAQFLEGLTLPPGLAVASDKALPATTVVVAAGAAGTEIDLAAAARRILALLEAAGRQNLPDTKGHSRHG